MGGAWSRVEGRSAAPARAPQSAPPAPMVSVAWPAAEAPSPQWQTHKEGRVLVMEKVHLPRPQELGDPEIVPSYHATEVEIWVNIKTFKWSRVGLSTSCSNGVCRVSCGGAVKCEGLQCRSLSTSCSNGTCRINCRGGSGSGGGGSGSGGNGNTNININGWSFHQLCREEEYISTIKLKVYFPHKTGCICFGTKQLSCCFFLHHPFSL